MSKATHFRKCLLTTMAFISLSACAMFSGSETSGQYVDDTTITSKVKEALVADPKVSAAQIHVETMQGVVQLSGFTQSAKGEARAVYLARQVSGVVQVKDDIIVGVANPKN